MKLNTLNFSETKNWKIAVLVKDQSFRKKEIQEYYVDPLLARGFLLENIVALNLAYNEQGKAPVKFIKEHLTDVIGFLERNSIRHVLCADAAYFKVLCKLKKAEPYYGYTMPSISPMIKAALTVNYMQLFYQPQLHQRLQLGITAISKDYFGEEAFFQTDILKGVTFPESAQDIAKTLTSFLSYPVLTVDIETFGLELTKSDIASIALASSEKTGTAFLVQFSDERQEIKYLLRQFFYNYKGKLIFQRAQFDIKMLVHELFMSNRDDYVGMINGLEILTRDVEDTLILSYLATNSTSGNDLSLKYQAFEFLGNYALNEIKDVTQADVNELLRYNAKDALGTWFVYDKHRETVRKEQEDIYQNIYKPFIFTIAQTELVGLPFSKDQVLKTQGELFNIANTHYNVIDSCNIVKQFTKALRLEEAISYNNTHKKVRKTSEDFVDLRFNPNSNNQLRKLLYEYLKLPVQQTTDTGLPSTDGKAIDGLINYLKKEHDL